MRYLKASLFIAIVSTVIVAGLFAAGFTTFPDHKLIETYRFSLSYPPLIPVPLQYGVIFIFAWLFAWTTIDIIPPLKKTLIAFLGVVLLLTGSYVLSLYGHLVTPFHYCAAVVVSFLIGLGYGRSDSGIRKKVLEHLFQNRLSPKQFNRLVDSDIPFTFPGVMQEATVLVCEIRNHEELMSALSVEDYVTMTNLYLRTATDYLVDIGAYLDECDGESLRVVFGAPLPDDKHASIACRSALELVHRLDNVNKECDAKWHRRFDFRIGINSGYMIAGAYGGTRFGGFSVAGEAVEFARRLCVATGYFGARILIASDTYNLASSTFEARPIELIKRPTDGQRLEIYEILSAKNGLSPERAKSRDHFWKGVIYFREQNWDKAVEEFSKARIQGLPDAVLDFYVQRVERWRSGKMEARRDQSILLNPVA
ncbi:MAG: adenylate/guanylate cyclase domain-containing protein [Chthoniobacterales bacterium]